MTENKDWYGLLVKTLALQTKGRKKEIEEFNKEIGEPDSKIVLEVEEEYGITTFGAIEYGFWNTDRGVVKLRKYKNGYHPESMVLISDEEIEAIIRARGAK